MTGDRLYHRSSAIEWMALPCLKERRVVLEVRQLCTSQVLQLREYFYNKRHFPFYNNIFREDNGYTLLHLADPNGRDIRHATPEQLAIKCRGKFLHGQHLLAQDQPNCIVFTYIVLQYSSVGGFTQNNNDSYNQLIWKITPKIVSCGPKIV